ncbi:MAG: response regulator [Deltaproteobacteria bacterium]|nr:response regulator [Nannocystaceae bacterium]
MSTTVDESMPCPHVIVIDDERQNRELLVVMLEHEGFEVSAAGSGEEALAAITARPPDLVLLDIMMPGMDGFEVATRIKRNVLTKHIPVIMLTALDDQPSRLRGLEAGAEDFVSRPIDRAELCVRVRNLLRLKSYADLQEKYRRILETEAGARAAELVESERLYRSTFDAAPVGIVHVGLDGTWLRVNRRVCDLLGYSRAELEGPSVQALVQSDADAVEEHAFEAMVAGTLEHYVVREKKYRRRDGSFVWGRVNMSVHASDDGRSQHCIAVIEDITEQRALEERLRQAGKMDAIGQLASGIAHDFNNLLSVVLSYSELLVARLAADDPTRADLEEIHRAGVRAVELTRQLLAFSRKQLLQPKIVDVGLSVGGVANMLRRLIGADVELTTPIQAELGKIMVDPGQLEQVIMNLAVNAREAMPDGGKLTIEASEVVLEESYCSKHDGVTPGPHVMLSVRDTGIGMDVETQARIFEPFFTTKAPGKGTGLGLATVFGVVRQSGGAISVESEPGRGTTFRVYFPTADPALVAANSSPLESDPVRGGTETILLCEDEESVRVLACTILRKYGYDVLAAQGPGDAILVCEQHPSTIDLLLTDVVMPRLSGRVLAERLLELRPSLRVMYMSGYMDDEVVRRAAIEATHTFLQKPITPEALARKVRESLDRVPSVRDEFG